MLRAHDRRLDAFAAAALEATDSGEFGTELRDWSQGGARLVSTDLAPQAMQWLKDLKPRLNKASDRARARRAVAERLDRLTRTTDYTRKLAEKLHRARRSAAVAIRLSDGKIIRRWDVKTGNTYVDPDDAREEAARFSKRVMPVLEDFVRQGCSLHFAVLTTPNAPAGELRNEKRRIFRRLRNLRRRCKDGKVLTGSNIIGSIAVLEAPLSARLDWNVHLNVIFVVKPGGYLDYGAVQHQWFYNAHLEPIDGNPEAIAKSLRELIKYAVQAVPEKSAHKARLPAAGHRLHSGRAQRGSGISGVPTRRADGSGRAEGDRDLAQQCDLSPDPTAGRGFLEDPVRGGVAVRETPPAFVAWPDWAIHEGLAAQRRFRRTRTYGALYRLPKPEKLKPEQFLYLGLIVWRGTSLGYMARFPLLDSIPGDKSTSHAERWAHLCRLLGAQGPPAVNRPRWETSAIAAGAS